MLATPKTLDAPAIPDATPIRARRLLGPGPSEVHPTVLAALAQPVVGHMDPQFLALMADTQSMLRSIFRTTNRMTLPISGTGSAGMEAALANLLQPQDEILIASAGYFADRMAEMAARLGGIVRTITKPWGEVFSAAEIEDALRRWPGAGVVGIVHGETSTGTLQPLDEIGALCRAHDRILLVDAVATLGGMPLEVDAWQIDACYAGSQKCLSAPPGLAPLTFGPRAMARLERRTSKVASWYFDLSGLEKYWTTGRRAYHHTAPISMNYALNAAARRVLEEGLEARWDRHRRLSSALSAGVEALGFRRFAAADCRLPVVVSLWLPGGLDDAAARKELLDRHDIEVAGGLGEFAGRIWRVGLMGDSATPGNVRALLAALEGMLGAPAGSAPGPAIAAAERSGLA